MDKIEARSNRIAQQLGMSHGAAANRLRKLVLFRQLEKHQENICVKCGEKILTVEDLSIEHIQPWEGRDASLFWDLNNIAFSHMVCNQPHLRRGGTPRRTQAPEGTSWCYTHKAFLPVEKFNKKPERWNGLRHECSECEIKYKNSMRAKRQSSSSSSSCDDSLRGLTEPGNVLVC